MTTEIQKIETPVLIIGNHTVDVYAESYQKTWAKMKAELPPAPEASSEHLEKVVELQTKGKSRYKEFEELRKEKTRQYDEIKKALIAKTNLLSEEVAGTPLFEAAQYIKEVRRAIDKRQQEEAAKAAQELEKAQMLAQIPVKFEGLMKQSCIALQGETKSQLQASIYRASTEEALDVVESTIRKPIVLTPEQWSAMANKAVREMAVHPDYIPVITETNTNIKYGLILAFNNEMQSFQKELMTHLDARRQAIKAGAKADIEAAESAALALQKQAEEEAEKAKAEAERQANIASIEASMEVVEPTVHVDIKKKMKCEPKDMTEWTKVIAIALADGVFDAAWCQKNLGKALTNMEKRYKAGNNDGVQFVAAY